MSILAGQWCDLCELPSGTVAAMVRAMQLWALGVAPLQALRVAAHVAVWGSILATRLAVPYLAAIWGM
jgi:hypothetical protein